MKRTLLLLLLFGCASTRPAPALFEFHDNFWLNLHHFARAVGRGMPASGALEPAEREAWDASIAFYRDSYSKRDLLEKDMIGIKNELRRFEGRDSLTGAQLDDALRATLERMAPIYRKYWWPAHRDANEAWIAKAGPLVATHGRALSQRVASALDATWPVAPIPVDLAVTAGPNGAFTTSPPTHTTIAVTDPSYQGLSALEMLFHEASHAWGLDLQKKIREAEARHQKDVPRGLWHAVLFYNAGELTRRALQDAGMPGYVEAGVRNGVYRDFCGDGCRERIAAVWDRHLAGSISMDEALDSLVASWPAK